MKKDLSPLSGHTAGIRAKLTKTAMKNESPKEAAPTDLCNRCNMLGQRLKNYTNSPQEWLVKQECYKCRRKGHLAVECSNRGTRNTSNKWVTDTKGINLPALVSLLKTHDLKENN